jgi:dihydroorotase
MKGGSPIMMNRRCFLSGAAGAAMLSPATRALAGPAQQYDLIVRGGRVIDPSLGIDAVRDVAVLGGRIAAVEENLARDAREIIDARGKLVVPGLIDIHTHAARSKDGPPLALLDGVTSYVDAGPPGAAHERR